MSRAAAATESDLGGSPEFWQFDLEDWRFGSVCDPQRVPHSQPSQSFGEEKEVGGETGREKRLRAE